MTTDGWRHKILTAAAALALVLVVTDFIVAELNRSAQVEINRRQQFVNEDVELGRVNQTLVHALRIAAVRNNDPKLQGILAEQGITVGLTPSVGMASPAGSAGAAGSSSRKVRR